MQKITEPFVAHTDPREESEALGYGVLPATPVRFEVPHEPTHRHFEPPRIISVSQAAAGYTLIYKPSGLHYAKILGGALTLSAAGTLQFLCGTFESASDGALSGAMAIGGAAAPILVLPIVSPENPYLFGSPEQAVGINTVTGLARGWLLVCESPYDR